MTFGLSAGTIFGAVAPTVIGGLMGGSKGSNSATTTQQAQIDPRMAGYLYGANGSGGLMSGVNNLYQQQFAQGGLNPMQNAGLEMQRQTLMSPQFTQGFDQMRNLGSGLMGQGVAGNPFSGGQTAQGAPSPAAPAAPEWSSSQAAAHWTPPPGTSSIGPRIMPGGGGMLSAANQPIQQQQAAPQPAMSTDQVQSMIDDMIKKYGAGTPSNGSDIVNGQYTGGGA